jgi:hypothetical protein
MSNYYVFVMNQHLTRLHFCIIIHDDGVVFVKAHLGRQKNLVSSFVVIVASSLSMPVVEGVEAEP